MPAERDGPAAGNGQHYESFIVRVLLNDDGSTRDTRMEHIGTSEVKRWAGWEHDAMLGFIKEAAVPTAPPVLLAGGLPPGIYLLEAAVSLRAAGASHGGVAAMAEGIMLQVLPS